MNATIPTSTPRPYAGGVVVATDGSQAATGAVRWAAHEAARLEVPLDIVAVHAVPLSPGPAPVDAMGLIARQRVAAEADAKEAAVLAARLEPELDIARHVYNGDAGAVLRDLSQSARLLVVGSRGRGGMSGTLFGSVADGLVASAQCPVVVVHEDAAQMLVGELEPLRPVVVATDLTESAHDAVRFAFDLAAATQHDLVVVHVSDQPDARTPELEAATAALRLLHPEVSVTHRVLSGSDPQAVITATSAEAAHLVVGSRGRGRLAGALLGSVSRAVSRSSQCPVTVLPAA